MLGRSHLLNKTLFAALVLSQFVLTGCGFSVSPLTKSANVASSTSSAPISILQSAQSGTAWQNVPIAKNGSQNLSIQFDLAPNAAMVNGLITLADGITTSSVSSSIAIRLNSNGNFDVLKAGAFAADNVIKYVPNVTYHFVITIDLAAQSFSVSVAGANGLSQALANNYPFRKSASNLSDFGFEASVGAFTISNVTVAASLLSVNPQPVSGSPPAPMGGPSSTPAPGPVGTPPPAGVSGGVGTFKHVFIVVLENASYSESIADPQLSAFARNGALLTNYDAVSHPSEPNYIAMVAGSDFGIQDDDIHTYNNTNIADLLEAKGLTWKNYAEGFGTPADCPNAYSPVDVNHVPFLAFADINTNLNRCHQHIVDASQLQVDIKNGNLPNYALYSPDTNNDGHDTSVAFAGTWFANTIAPLFKDPNFMTDTLVVLIFDEDDGGGNNQVYAALQGNMVAPGSSSAAAYNHYSLLRTIEDNFGIGNLGRNDAAASAITGIWK